MPNPHKVKFKEDGSRCTKNLQKLRRLPECGIFDRNILPFHPVHPTPQPPPDPKHPFHPFTMSIPGVLNDRLIPDQPERPNPVFPDENGTLVGGATGPGSQYSAPQLPQDQTNVLFRGSGRVLHEESRFGITPTFFGPKGYHTVPVELQGGDALARPIQPANYRNEDADRVIQEMDDILASHPPQSDIELMSMEQSRRVQETDEVVRATLEAAIVTDDGASVIPQPRRMSFGPVDPDRVPGVRRGRGGSGVKKRVSTLKTQYSPRLSRRIRARTSAKSNLSALEQLHANMSQAAYIQDIEALQNYVDRYLRGWRVDAKNTNEFMKTFVNKESGDVAVAFRGTQHGVLAAEAPHLDDLTNMVNAMMGSARVENEQTRVIDATMRSIIDTYGRPPDMYSGHSRGGAEVQIAKQTYGGGQKGATVFNSAPSGTNYGEDGINRIRTRNDVVSIADAHRSRSIDAIEGSGAEESHRITNFSEPLIEQPRSIFVDGLNTIISSGTATNIDASESPTKPLLNNRMRKSAFEIDTVEGMYLVRSNRGSAISEARRGAERASSMAKRIAQDAKRASAMRKAKLLSVAKGKIQELRTNTVRQFNKGYERLVSDSRGIRMAQVISGGGRPIDIEMDTLRTNVATTDTGDITVRRPVTQDVTGLRELDLDFSPFDQVVDEPTVIGRTAPKLSFSERIKTAGASFKDVTVRNTTAGAGAVGVGFLAGMGVSHLFKDVDFTHNKLGNASVLGGLSGLGGDLAARTAVAIGQRTLGRSVATAAADSALYAGMRAGSAILRGGAEGLLIGAATAPLDLLLNDALMKSGSFSHAGANTVSSGVIGLGTTATIGAVALAAAPETLGLSLVVGGLATLGSIIFGAVTGHQQDEAEEKAKREQEEARHKVISTANARKQLLESLPSHDYNFQQALSAFSDKSGLGVDDETWSAFQSSTMKLFVVRPSNSPAPGPGSGGAAASGDQKRLNDLFSKYITHSLISRVCTGGTDCTELSSRDPGSLTSDEETFLNDKTGNTWQPQADMQVEMSVQELQYTQQRIGDAKKQMVDAWNNHQTLPNQLDPYVVETAYLDSKWEDKFKTAIKFDAQDKVIDAYATNQTKMEQMPPNIQTAAGYDPEFSTVMHAYYDDMESIASQLEVDVSQLIVLQGLEGEAQRNRYQEMQFDRIKTQPDVVKQAGELAEEQDTVRAAGFYDIDQAFLDGADPTDISQWHPSDSQILQAHAAGMNLNQYVAYMHQLALGDAGDYRKLPTYTEKELRDFGKDDYAHLQNDLQMAGLNPELYDYDPDTRTFTLNPNITNVPNLGDAKSFVSSFTPGYLVRARREYADMIHGLNENNQAQVDQYNTRLLRDLQAYGAQYNEMVSAQNEYLISHSGPVTQLLHYHVNDVYNQYRLDYNPLSESLPTKETTIVDGNTVSTPASVSDPGRGLVQKENTVPVRSPIATPMANVTLVPGIVGSDAPLPESK